MSLIFQLLDIRIKNITRLNPNYNKTLIQLFGKTEKGDSVYIEIDDYNSKFYTNASEDEILNVINEEIETLKELKDKQKDKLTIKKINQRINSLEYYKDIINIYEGEEYKEFYYFNFNKVKVSKIESNSIVALKTISNLLFEEDYKIYEINKDTILQFIHDRKIKSCGWVEIKNNKLNDLQNYYYYDTKEEETENTKQHIIYSNIGNCNINKSCNTIDINPADKEYDLKIAPFILCAYDIECISSDDGFPQYNRKSDKIVSIACTFNKINELCYKRVCLMINDNTKNKLSLSKYGEGYKIISCNNELDLITKYFDLIRNEDPDIITGWNNFLLRYSK